MRITRRRTPPPATAPVSRPPAFDTEALAFVDGLYRTALRLTVFGR
jgi:hypothetical protein